MEDKKYNNIPFWKTTILVLYNFFKYSLKMVVIKILLYKNVFIKNNDSRSVSTPRIVTDTLILRRFLYISTKNGKKSWHIDVTRSYGTARHGDTLWWEAWKNTNSSVPKWKCLDYQIYYLSTSCFSNKSYYLEKQLWFNYIFTTKGTKYFF